MLVLAALGLWHVAAGTWRPGPGGGPALVPQLAFWGILPSAVVMLWAGIVRPGSAQTEAVRLAPILACVVWGLLYFWMVRKIGLVISTTLMLTVAMAALSPEPWRSLKIVVPVVLGCALAFWVMFTQVAPILQVRVWLF
jgi:hypothetical protein